MRYKNIQDIRNRLCLPDPGNVKARINQRNRRISAAGVIRNYHEKLAQQAQTFIDEETHLRDREGKKP